MKLIQRYSAAVILVWLALFFNVLHYYLEVVVEPAQGTAAFWLNTTAENLQSECWQVALAAWLFKHYRWQGTPDEREDAPNSPEGMAVPIAVVALFVVITAMVTS